MKEINDTYSTSLGGLESIDKIFDRHVLEQSNNLGMGQKLPYGPLSSLPGAVALISGNQTDLGVSMVGGVLNLNNGKGKGISIYRGTSESEYAQIKSAVNQIAPKFGLDPLLVMALIQQESTFEINQLTKNHSGGAFGLMQVNWDVLKDLNFEPMPPFNAKPPDNTGIFDVLKNIELGCTELSRYMKQYNNNIVLALACYNAGPGAVKKHHGVPPFSETQHYVQIIPSNYEKAKRGEIVF